MRPIDADALMESMYHRAFETDGDTMWQSGCWVRYRAIEQVVKEQPNVDAHPVTPMHWTPINPFNGGWSDVWRCSACGSQVSLGYCTDMMEYDFCPYCGARDGEQNGGID